MKNGWDILERFILKVTSGRFIFTLVVAYVYAYLALNGMLSDDRINEITLIVLYAYFSKSRIFNGNGESNGKEIEENKDKK